jgi:hypothetical protein
VVSFKTVHETVHEWCVSGGGARSMGKVNTVVVKTVVLEQKTAVVV